MDQQNVVVTSAPGQRPPRHCRVSHLTFSLLLARMLRGPVTAADIVETTGLNPTTAHELLRTMERHGAVHKDGTKINHASRRPHATFALGAAA